MKIYLILFLTFIYSTIVYSQPDIKGYKVGDNFEPALITIVGNTYQIYPMSIKHKGKEYFYILAAEPQDRYGNKRLVTSELEIKNLVEAFNKKYQIDFDIWDIEGVNGNGTRWIAKKNEYEYKIESYENGDLEISIHDEDLYQRIMKEIKIESKKKNKTLQKDL